MANARRAVALPRILMTGVLLLWLAALVPGVRSLRAFETTAGKMGAAPGEWTAQVPAVGDPRLPTLVVALHPRCSCSKATLEELEKAAKEFNHPYNAVMLIFRSRGDKSNWEQTGLYREAQRTLHANVVMDDDGALAEKFGAFTSGEVLYYSAPDREAKRHLLFSGGVTGGRGMLGENAGAEALKIAENRQYLFPSENFPAKSKVYGCGFSVLSAPTGKLTTP